MVLCDSSGPLTKRWPWFLLKQTSRNCNLRCNNLNLALKSHCDWRTWPWLMYRVYCTVLLLLLYVCKLSLLLIANECLLLQCKKKNLCDFCLLLSVFFFLLKQIWFDYFNLLQIIPGNHVVSVLKEKSELLLEAIWNNLAARQIFCFKKIRLWQLKNRQKWTGMTDVFAV